MPTISRSAPPSVDPFGSQAAAAAPAVSLARIGARSFAIAFVVVTSAVAVRLVADRWLRSDPNAVFFAAVALAAWFGGASSGAVATVLAVLAQAYFCLEPRGSFRVDNPLEVLTLTIWGAEGLLVSFFTGRLQRARNLAARSAEEAVSRTEVLSALLQARDELEAKVAERAVELSASHQAVSQALDSLKENQRALLAGEKMALLGRLTAGVAHELASPLSAIAAAVLETENLVDEYHRSIDDPDVDPNDHREIAAEMRKTLGIARLAADRSSAFVRSIKAQTRVAIAPLQTSFDLVAATRDSIALLAHAARASRCTVTLAAPSEFPAIVGDPNRLGQLVTNLVHNAIDASAEQGGGTVAVSLGVDQGRVTIQVRDDGRGIPDDVLSRIFEPLFTTKPYGKGTGLGLAIVKEIAEVDFGGHVAVHTTSSRGTTFIVDLPQQKEGQSHGA